MIFEICVDSVQGALAAQAAGAQRIELCANLVEGGTTPSVGMIKLTRLSTSLAVNVIIRPRGGDFCYTGLELETMRQDIQAAKLAGADGVVFGLLNTDGSVDLEKTRRLVDLSRPLNVTFHRAFDLCHDPYQALEALCGLGITRLLTSGQKPSAMEGAGCIASLQQQSAGRIIIMAGGGINAENIVSLVAQTGISEVHFASRKIMESPMNFRNLDVHMGKAYQPDEYVYKETDQASVQNIIRQITKH